MRHDLGGQAFHCSPSLNSGLSKISPAPASATSVTPRTHCSGRGSRKEGGVRPGRDPPVSPPSVSTSSTPQAMPPPAPAAPPTAPRDRGFRPPRRQPPSRTHCRPGPAASTATGARSPARRSRGPGHPELEPGLSQVRQIHLSPTSTPGYRHHRDDHHLRRQRQLRRRLGLGRGQSRFAKTAATIPSTRGRSVITGGSLQQFNTGSQNRGVGHGRGLTDYNSSTGEGDYCTLTKGDFRQQNLQYQLSPVGASWTPATASNSSVNLPPPVASTGLKDK